MSSSFQRLTREPRLSDRVATLLLARITSGELVAGQRLPPERVLGEQLGVSRTVVREAVRVLVAKGVIDARSRSGLRVATVEASAVAESMNLFLMGRELGGYEDIHDVRVVVEVHVAGLAAERATEIDVAHMGDVCESFNDRRDDIEAESQADVAFHRAVAEASHNPLYLIILDSIGDVLLDIRRATLGIPGRPEASLSAHRRILKHIAAHNVKGARDAMRAHLADAELAWRHLDAEKKAT
jgi:GntR family transcriptional repressor for pyruvate dehydrogenase complex